VPAVELATPAEAAAVAVPYSVRLAARRSAAAQALREELLRRQAAPQERRAYARRAAAELAWLRAARLRHGPGVALVDLSEGGALLDAEVPLKPGARMVLELEGEGGNLKVPLSVLRAHVARLQGELMIYRGACAFIAPVDLAVLLAAPVAAAREELTIDLALTRLLERLGTDGSATSSRDALDAGKVLHVLESLQTRVIAGGADAYRRGVAGLLAAVLPELHRGTSPVDVAALIAERANSLVAGVKYSAVPSAAQARETQHRIAHTAELLRELLARLPAIPDERSVQPPSAPPADNEAAPVVTPSAPDAADAWQKIVVRYREGRLLKGFTQDFHPSRGHFSLWPSVTASRSERVIVPLSRLKAVFFVRNFDGDPGYIDRDVGRDTAGAGRRVEVTFVDNEVVRGTTLSYRPDGYGFFVLPADQRSNNQRIFVVSAALRHVRFP
jgi:hypothetical protein